MFPQEGKVYIPEWLKLPSAPNPLPGTLRYVVLDKDNQLVFESDDSAVAFANMNACGGIRMIDRGMKPRVNTFAGTFDTFPPKE